MLRNKPAEFTGYKLFLIPFLIMEVEGSKAGWGKSDQQAKAMREVLVSLAVMPECYLIFIYPDGIEIWKAERNHARCKIDVTAERIDWNDGERSLYEALLYFLERIQRIVAYAAVELMPILEFNVASLRVQRKSMATGHTRNVWGRDCCEECYIVADITSAKNNATDFPNVHLYYEGLPRPQPEEETEMERARRDIPRCSLCVKKKGSDKRQADPLDSPPGRNKIPRSQLCVKKRSFESPAARRQEGRNTTDETGTKVKKEVEEEEEDCGGGGGMGDGNGGRREYW